MDRAAAEPAEILSDRISLDREARRASSVDVDDDSLAIVERALEAERIPLSLFFGEPLTEREGPGFLRYRLGGFYRPHRDRGDIASWPGAARRRIALVIFLNQEFSGGVLRLHDEASSGRDIVPRQGLLAAFSADTLHEVTPVEHGTRDTVVDWFY